MIGITILYPKSEGSTFDMDYYVNSHMPMFAAHLGEAVEGWGVTAPFGDEYHAIGWMTLNDGDAFGTAMAEHGAEVLGDVANYTNAQPSLQMGSVVK